MWSHLGDPEGAGGQLGGAQRVHRSPGAQEGLLPLAVGDCRGAHWGRSLLVPTQQPRGGRVQLPDREEDRGSLPAGAAGRWAAEISRLFLRGEGRHEDNLNFESWWWVTVRSNCGDVPCRTGEGEGGGWLVSLLLDLIIFTLTSSSALPELGSKTGLHLELFFLPSNTFECWFFFKITIILSWACVKPLTCVKNCVFSDLKGWFHLSPLSAQILTLSRCLLGRLSFPFLGLPTLVLAGVYGVDYFVESQNALGWKGPSEAIQPIPLQWAGTSPPGSGCWEPRPAWPGMFRGMGHWPPLGNLGQGFTTLIVKTFVLMSSLNLPCLSLKPLLLAL